MDTKLIPVLQGLVDSGVLTNEQALATQLALGAQATPRTLNAEESHSRREIISEALTYVGFVFVIAASALLTNQAWESLGRWGHPALLAAGAGVLFSAGLWMRQSRRDASGRRLSSTLFTGSEALVAATIAVILTELWVPKNPAGIDSSNVNWKDTPNWVGPSLALLTALGALTVGLVYYMISHSALGHIALAIPSAAVVISFGQLINVWTSQNNETGPPRVGFALLFLGGLAWLWFAEQKILCEKVLGQVLGLGALYIGLQGLDVNVRVWIAGIAVIGLGVALLAMYLRNRSWPYLAGGIIGMFGGGVRMLVEYVHGTTGALASLALGVLLVVFGVRLVSASQNSMSVQAETNAHHTSQLEADAKIGANPESSGTNNSHAPDKPHREVEPF